MHQCTQVCLTEGPNFSVPFWGLFCGISNNFSYSVIFIDKKKLLKAYEIDLYLGIERNPQEPFIKADQL